MVLPTALLALIPTAVAAPPADSLSELAQVLGRAHGLHRLCAGPIDNLWRGRMERLLIVEHVTPARRVALVGRFNAGFAQASAEHAACDDAANTALLETAARGAQLAADQSRRTADGEPAPIVSRGRAP